MQYFTYINLNKYVSMQTILPRNMIDLQEMLTKIELDEKLCCINRFTSLCKNLFNLIDSEVNLLIQHIIVQDQDEQNNNMRNYQT